MLPDSPDTVSERLLHAIMTCPKGGDDYQSKIDALHAHIRGQGLRGSHSTRRSLQRWLAGRGTPPPQWMALASHYLGVSQRWLSAGEGRKEGAVNAERWAKETTYIIGGGPSAGRHDLTQLDGIIIAVNDSAVQLPDADVCFTASPPWVRHRRRFLREFSGTIVVQSAYSHSARRRLHLPRRAITLPLRRRPGVEERERQRGHNSGQEALHWAADQGARRIILVGFDMTEPRNWHGVYEWQPNKEGDPTFDYQRWARNFKDSARELEARGIEVFNANEQSAVRCFPFIDLPVPRRKMPGLKCAVIIPVGPGHEEYSNTAVESVLRAWHYDSGPFAAMTVSRVWDVDGELGRSGARNKGLDENPADFHFLLDADDTMMPDAFRYVELEAPATFGAVLMDRAMSAENHWPVTWETIREHGAHGTLSMGCFLQGDLGIRFQEGIPVGQDFDFYMRLPGFVKVRKPLVNIGYRKPRAGSDSDRPAVAWLDACRTIIDSYLPPEAASEEDPPEERPKRRRKTSTTPNFFEGARL